jgi:HK97 gp10 family phage protein
MLKIDMDFSHITATLKKLPQSMQKEMLGKAVSAGASVVKKATLQRVPQGATGNLRKSVVVKKLRTRSPFLSAYTVKFAQGGRFKGYHSHLIEFGHFIWKRKRRGRGAALATGKKFEMVSTGRKTKPHPMLRPAFFTNRAKIIDAIAKRLSAEKIERDVLRKIRTRAKVVARR